VFTRVDRVQLAVADRRVAASGWIALLGAEHESDDRVSALGARRSTYRLGTGRVEILEPDGTGPVADAVSARGGHLYAGGLTTSDMDSFLAHVRSRGVEPDVEGEQAHFDVAHTGGHGLRLVVSADHPGSATGAIDHFYEVTSLVLDAPGASAHYADLFGLDASSFTSITSPHYGYAGTLTLFDPDRLDRLEVIAPDRPATTMGRYFARFGESLYMAFAETDQIATIAARAAEIGAGVTVEPPENRQDERGAHTMFIHPSSLGGMMLGLSRRDYAWRWSGRPEIAEGGA
jgi:hypothetical protein